MPGPYSARAIRLAVTVTVFGLSSAVAGGPAVAAPAAAGVTHPVTGKLESATKHSLVLVRSGTKKLTPILLNAKTMYIVNGKRVTRAPVLTPGSLISVVTAGAKGPATAQVVAVSPAPSPWAAPLPPVNSATAPPTVPTAIKGVVTLTSPVSVTLQTSAGTETIKLTSTTQYIVTGKASTVKPILHAGERVKITAVQTHGILVGKVFTVL
jgi:hypothetical protein